MRIAQAAQAMLENGIVPFWKNLRDDENGGYYGYMDFDLQLDKTAEKGCGCPARKTPRWLPPPTPCRSWARCRFRIWHRQHPPLRPRCRGTPG